jgi:outer membrane protein assembly factor BamB
MTIKVQCGCGARYSFEVEPQNGVMPSRVTCPACNADGTDAANQVIAQTLEAEQKAQPRLHKQAVAVRAVGAPAIPPPQPFVSASIQKLQVEARQMRRIGWMAAGVFLVFLALLGAWSWYTIVGSKPRLAYTIKVPGSDFAWHTELLEGGKILLANPAIAILRDLHTQQDLWRASYGGNTSDDASPPQVLADKQNVWICAGNQVMRLDLKSGEVKQTIPIVGQLASFMPTDSSIMVVSATSQTRRVAMRIDLSSGEVASQHVEIPRAQMQAMPDELPPNVQPTAGVLLAQATEEIKFNKPLNAVSSEFFSAGQNLVELRVKLLEPRVNWVKSIKPRGPSVLNGNTSTSTSTAAVEEEVFNDIKRDRTGGVKAVDESLYEVRLRRWQGEKPEEWKGQVAGVPAFFALQTVDLLTAGKSLTVFDKQNNKLFATQLSYPISERFAGEFTGRPHVPAVERAGVLYFFDQGVLTALALPGGEVKWRLTSIGISRVQFDDAGMLYVDSTAASPEDIQYSEQIKFESTPAVIMKVDPLSGKILWQAQNLGQQSFLSGKYLYTATAQQGGNGMVVGLAEAVNAPRPETEVHYHIYRLDPASGDVMWSFFRKDAPDEEMFQRNWFVLRFGAEVQAWSFLDF